MPSSGSDEAAGGQCRAQAPTNSAGMRIIRQQRAANGGGLTPN
ncbi:hypothetical protein [Hymenobacter elongatus]|nr:hypothetical protein [Hymenobacter elongatus]